MSKYNPLKDIDVIPGPTNTGTKSLREPGPYTKEELDEMFRELQKRSGHLFGLQPVHSRRNFIHGAVLFASLAILVAYTTFLVITH